MEVGEENMKAGDLLAAIGLGIGAISLVAQLSAPTCPTCGTKLTIINNYCINCRVSWTRHFQSNGGS